MTITKRMAGIYNKALDYFKTGTDGKGLDMQALAFAIIALEKQIPKKLLKYQIALPAVRNAMMIFT